MEVSTRASPARLVGGSPPRLVTGSSPRFVAGSAARLGQPSSAINQSKTPAKLSNSELKRSSNLVKERGGGGGPPKQFGRDSNVAVDRGGGGGERGGGERAGGGKTPANGSRRASFSQEERPPQPRRRNSERYASNSSAYAARRKFARGGSGGGGGRGGNARMVLPTKFLLGGNINDPLNLNSLCDEAVNESLNAPTPVPSPSTLLSQAAMLDPPLEVIRPLNMRDPLNLGDVEGGDTGVGVLMRAGGGRRRKRRRFRKKKNAGGGGPPYGVSADALKSLTESQRAGELSDPVTPAPRRSEAVRKLAEGEGDAARRSAADRIVSPVIPQQSPRAKRRRTSSEGRMDSAVGGIKRACCGGTKMLSGDGKGEKAAEKPASLQPAPVRSRSKSKRGSTQQQSTAAPKRFRPADAKFTHGNYSRYYGYRNPDGLGEIDPRLALLSEGLLSGKDVLDIGCNVGHVTLSVARDFGPKRITGIDIDRRLIDVAKRNVRHFMDRDRRGHGSKVNLVEASAGSEAWADMVSPVSGSNDNLASGSNTDSALGGKANLVSGSNDADLVSCINPIVGSTASQVLLSCVTATETDSILNSSVLRSAPIIVSANASLPSCSSVVSSTVRDLVVDVGSSPLISSAPFACSTNVLSAGACSDNIRSDNICLENAARASSSVDNACCLMTTLKDSTFVDYGTVDLKTKSDMDTINSVDGSSRVVRDGSRGTVDRNRSHADSALMSPTFPVSMGLLYGPLTSHPVATKGSLLVEQQNEFPHNVMFLTVDYVPESDMVVARQCPTYDVILALSVTKWMHLNGGDAALKRAFRRMHAELRTGGKLVLEAQPWASYRKKKKLTENIFSVYQSIVFRPEHFRDYLLSSEVGFVSCEPVGAPINKSKGFQRAIEIYTK